MLIKIQFYNMLSKLYFDISINIHIIICLSMLMLKQYNDIDEYKYIPYSLNNI